MRADGSVEPMAVKSKADIVREWALSKEGCGYVWGATGYVLSQSRLNSLKEQYPDNVNEDIVKKWIGKEVYDCA